MCRQHGRCDGTWYPILTNRWMCTHAGVITWFLWTSFSAWLRIEAIDVSSNILKIMHDQEAALGLCNAFSLWCNYWHLFSIVCVNFFSTSAVCCRTNWRGSVMLMAFVATLLPLLLSFRGRETLGSSTSVMLAFVVWLVSVVLVGEDECRYLDISSW